MKKPKQEGEDEIERIAHRAAKAVAVFRTTHLDDRFISDATHEIAKAIIRACPKLAEHVAAAVGAEREACAALADKTKAGTDDLGDWWSACDSIAKAIRERAK